MAEGRVYCSLPPGCHIDYALTVSPSLSLIYMLDNTVIPLHILAELGVGRNGIVVI